MFVINQIFRDMYDKVEEFEPIALIEHQGAMLEGGETCGHYICDLKDEKSKLWFRTNDNLTPFQINEQNVTKKPVVVLYKKIKK